MFYVIIIDIRFNFFLNLCQENRVFIEITQLNPVERKIFQNYYDCRKRCPSYCAYGKHQYVLCEGIENWQRQHFENLTGVNACSSSTNLYREKFEDIQGVIKSHNSKNDRKYKTNNARHNTTQKD